MRDGNPKKHQDAGTTSSSPTSTCHPEPVHVRRRALERDGRVRSVAARRARPTSRRRPICSSCSGTSSCRTRAPATRSTPSSAGKGDVLSRTRTRRSSRGSKGHDLQFVIPKSTILIENPIAVLKTSAKKAAGATSSSASCKTPAAQQVFADNGYRPVVKSVLEAQPEEVPGAAGPLHDRPARPRRLEEGAEAVLRPDNGDHGGDRAQDRRRHWLRSRSTRRAPRTRASRDRAATALSLGIVTTFLTLMRRAAARRARLGGDGARARTTFWEAVSSPEAVAALEADPRRLARRRRS